MFVDNLLEERVTRILLSEFRNEWNRILLNTNDSSTSTSQSMTLLPNKRRLLPSNRSCTDQSCSNFLATSDSIAFQHCTKVAFKFGPIDQGKCVFMNGTGRQSIAWFCTGSLSCNPDLRRHGFVGESITSGSVIQVIYRQFIYIIRNPIIAERNLQLSDYSSRHINSAYDILWTSWLNIICTLIIMQETIIQQRSDFPAHVI